MEDVKEKVVAQEMMHIIVYGSPRTKKNSQRIVNAGGFHRIMPSKAYDEWLRECVRQLRHTDTHIEQPVNVKCLFYMPTKRRVDLVNLLEAVDDMLQDKRIDIIADDNCSIVAGHDGSRVLYDKSNPRVEIRITPMSML